MSGMTHSPLWEAFKNVVRYNWLLIHFTSLPGSALLIQMNGDKQKLPNAFFRHLLPLLKIGFVLVSVFN